VPNPFDLAEPALALAKKVGSTATNVHQARQDTLFRASGLLPGFSAANQEIGDSAMQVRICLIVVTIMLTLYTA
jgi:hypothetical protein